MGIINAPFAWVLKTIAELMDGNFAASIFLFTLIINIILIPLSVKSQKSAVQQTRIKPKLDKLKERYGDDRQKLAQAQQELYQNEKISMSGGCLPMLLRLVLMMCIYTIILSPLSYLMDVDKKAVSTVRTSPAVVKILDKKAPSELDIIKAIESKKLTADKLEESKKEDAKELKDVKTAIEEISESISNSDLDFELLGIDLTETPKFSFNIFKKFQLNWLMPVIAFLAQILTSLVSMKMQKKINPDAPSMSGMLLMMPLFSLYIGFTLSCGVTFYWACSSIIGGVIQTAIQYYYGPHKMLANERLKELNKQADFEAGQIKKFTSSEN
ncbi:MAG: membrane protein insertase YidC [Clostridia bacterium]|nr:membrane protein insertase YidC [Clostridia bacterium]